MVLGVTMLALSALLLLTADLSHEPRTIRGSDYAATSSPGSCLDWWCRGKDLFLVILSGVLLVSALAALLIGARRRSR